LPFGNRCLVHGMMVSPKYTPGVTSPMRLVSHLDLEGDGEKLAARLLRRS
jgi:hypothetical protein